MAKNRGTRVEPYIYRRLSGGFLVRMRRGNAGEIVRVVQTIGDARVLKLRLLMSKNGVEIVNKQQKLRDVLEAYAARLESQSKRSDVVRWLNGKILAHFGENCPAPLTDDDMDGWASSGAGDYIRRGIAQLRTAHRRAGLPVPKAPEYEYEPGHRLVVPEEQVRALVSQMPWGSPERAVAELMLLTSARLTHILALTVADVSGQFMVIRSRKGRGLNRLKIEEHPITPRMKAVLESVIPPDARPEARVILVNGRPADDSSFRKRLLAASRRAKIDPPIQSLAWLRNFTVTQLIEGGVPIDVVSRMAGHSSVVTTRKHYDRAKLLKARADASAAMASTMLSVGTGPHENSTEVAEIVSFCPVSKEDTPGVVGDKSETPN